MSIKGSGLFRIGMVVFGVAGLFAGCLTAQGFETCTATGGVPPIIRATGVSELLGDIVINCTGGTPTGSGFLIPQENFQVSINANMTNRTFPQFPGISDALLIIDDAFPANPVPSSASPAPGAPPQILCTAFGGNCREIGTGVYPARTRHNPTYSLECRTEPTE